MNMESQIQHISVDLIIPNRFQPRLTFDEKSLSELSQSIKEHGIIQPIVVRRLGEKYEIIAGERRYKAAVMAGLTEVPIIISNIDDSKSIEVAVLENIQRKNLTSIEEAKSYKKILDKGYLTQDVLAKRLGISQSTIANKLRLLNLSLNVQNALMQERISERHARSLLQIEDEDLQDAVLNKIINERMTVKQLDDYIKSLNVSTVKNMESSDNVENYSDINNIFGGNVFNDSQNDNTQDVVETREKEDEIGLLVDGEKHENKENDISASSLIEEIDKIKPTEVLEFESDDKLTDDNIKSDNSFESLFKIFNQETYPSLEDESANMNTDLDNIFNANSYEVDENTKEEEIKPEVITEIKEEFPIITGDLSSVKAAIIGLIQKIKAAGFDIDNEDYDFEDIYQLIVKIKK